MAAVAGILLLALGAASLVPVGGISLGPYRYGLRPVSGWFHPPAAASSIHLDSSNHEIIWQTEEFLIFTRWRQVGRARRILAPVPAAAIPVVPHDRH